MVQSRIHRPRKRKLIPGKHRRPRILPVLYILPWETPGSWSRRTGLSYSCYYERKRTQPKVSAANLDEAYIYIDLLPVYMCL